MWLCSVVRLRLIFLVAGSLSLNVQSIINWVTSCPTGWNTLCLRGRREICPLKRPLIPKQSMLIQLPCEVGEYSNCASSHMIQWTCYIYIASTIYRQTFLWQKRVLSCTHIKSVTQWNSSLYILRPFCYSMSQLLRNFKEW